MTALESLKILDYKIDLFTEELAKLSREVKGSIKEAQKDERNILLTKKDANEVMGYKSKQIYNLDAPFEDGKIRYNDLFEWAEKNAKNRLNYMRKNIKNMI